MASLIANVDLKSTLCADPVYGAVYKHLFNGGSWFEADQMEWRINQALALQELKTLVSGKPTKANQEKATVALGRLEESCKQLVPPDHAMAAFHNVEAIVKTWAPPPAVTVVTKKPKKGTNVFAALGDSDEE
jgi:hypothetical protein